MEETPRRVAVTPRAAVTRYVTPDGLSDTPPAEPAAEPAPVTPAASPASEEE